MLAVQSMMTLSMGSWMLAKWYVNESKFASVSCEDMIPLLPPYTLTSLTAGLKGTLSVMPGRLRFDRH